VLKARYLKTLPSVKIQVRKRRLLTIQRASAASLLKDSVTFPTSLLEWLRIFAGACFEEGIVMFDRKFNQQHAHTMPKHPSE